MQLFTFGATVCGVGATQLCRLVITCNQRRLTRPRSCAKANHDPREPSSLVSCRSFHKSDFPVDTNRFPSISRRRRSTQYTSTSHWTAALLLKVRNYLSCPEEDEDPLDLCLSLHPRPPCLHPHNHISSSIRSTSPDVRRTYKAAEIR